MESKNLLQYSQYPATGPRPHPDQSSPHSQILFLKDSVHPPVYACGLQWLLSQLKF